MSRRNPALQTMAAASLLLVIAVAAFGQQTKPQQKCLNQLNLRGAGVAKAQGKEDLGCLKKAGKGQLVGTAQACLTADEKGKVQKKKDKTVADDTKFCAVAPNFGYVGAATVNAAAMQGELDLTADVFGANLDAAVISCTSNKPGCLCQQKVMNRVELLAKTKLIEFRKCKVQALKGATVSAAQLVACVNDPGTAGSIAADTKGKIQKRIDKLNADIALKCDTPGVTATAFPGSCTSLSGMPLGACLDARAECRVCQIINEMDGLFVDCDLFDDGVANASCASGTGPTPTPTAVPTPTPPFVPGTIFQGALLKTNGIFNYNATLGVPGSDAACASSFAGSHTCAIGELQAAAAAGDLNGAVDSGNNVVTSFWAIDSTRPAAEQCFEAMSSIHWNYATSHTGTRGDVVTLNNPAGTLGAVTPDGLCSNQHWVGCCL